MDIIDKRCGDGANAKPNFNAWKPPPRPDPFTHEIARDLKDDI